jgi:hypothetical protein
MSVYRDAAHAISRIMSIETIDSTKGAGWQKRYQAGFPESRSGGEGLTPEERLTQDSMTRAALHGALTAMAWQVLVAKYSVNDIEVRDAVQWLIPRVQCPAHHLFKMKCVTAWAIPRRMPAGFYVLHTWDADGTPEGTLRRWRAVTKRWLEDRVDEAFAQAELVLVEQGVIQSAAA